LIESDEFGTVENGLADWLMPYEYGRPDWKINVGETLQPFVTAAM
jgi:hypothetical protein